MKRLILAIVVVLFSFPVVTSAQGFDDYVVQKGDSLWKIASEIPNWIPKHIGCKPNCRILT